MRLVTADLAPLGGRLARSADDFHVEEVPLYEAAGEGSHLYLTLRRRERTTFELERDLAGLFAVERRDVGSAGLKDRWATATQTFSLPVAIDPEEAAARVRAELGVEVLAARRHGNKLKTGHLLGNRFDLRIRGVGAGGEARAAALFARIAATGLPNVYGEQRYGGDGGNAERGRAVVEGRLRLPRSQRELMISALQSSLFDTWLVQRFTDGLGLGLIAGDVAKKTDTGGLFDVEDPDVEAPRFAAGAIVYTGPIFGGRMRAAGGEAGVREARVLEAAGLDARAFARAGSPGTRRPALVRPEAPTARGAGEGEDLRLAFFLPKGSYATVLLAEMGVDERR